MRYDDFCTSWLLITFAYFLKVRLQAKNRHGWSMFSQDFIFGWNLRKHVFTNNLAILEQEPEVTVQKSFLSRCQAKIMEVKYKLLRHWKLLKLCLFQIYQCQGRSWVLCPELLPPLPLLPVCLSTVFCVILLWPVNNVKMGIIVVLRIGMWIL